MIRKEAMGAPKIKNEEENDAIDYSHKEKLEVVISDSVILQKYRRTEGPLFRIGSSLIILALIGVMLICVFSYLVLALKIPILYESLDAALKMVGI